MSFVAYLAWAFIPDDALESLGVHYYPDKYWALAVPVWLFALGLYAAWAYEGVNLLSVRAEDDEDLVAEVGGSIPVFLRKPTDAREETDADPPGFQTVVDGVVHRSVGGHGDDRREKSSVKRPDALASVQRAYASRHAAVLLHTPRDQQPRAHDVHGET